jgi:4,5-DOPA dioxygenase extradiol
MARPAQEPKEYTEQSSLMPVGFIGHGAPTLALEKDNPVVEAWKAWGQSLPKPKAVLVVSAHWLQKPPHLGPLNLVPLTYDFSGFPQELYEVEYEAPPAPKLAKEILHLLERLGMKPGTNSDRGLDHGAWVPLMYLFPRADVPALQISIGTNVSMSEHLTLGQALAPLRSKGVFILGSGNMTHNLRKVDFSNREAPVVPWAKEFDEWCVENLNRFDLNSLANYQKLAPQAAMAHPTDDHFTPLLVAAAAAGKEGKPKIRYPYEGYEHGSLSMRCVEFQ